jgi:hypothetical protein
VKVNETITITRSRRRKQDGWEREERRDGHGLTVPIISWMQMQIGRTRGEREWE